MKVLLHAFYAISILQGLCLPVLADNFDSGINLFKSGKSQEAAVLLEQVVSKNPSDLKARYYLANVYATLGQRSKAVEQYTYCANAAPGTKMEEYCLKAMGMQNLKTNSLPALKDPMKDLQRDTELKVDRQAQEYKTNLETERERELKSLSLRLNAQADTITKQMQIDVDNVPRYIYVGSKRYSNPDYKSDVDKIKIEAAQKIDNLTNKQNSEYASLNQRYDKRLEEYMQSHDGIRSALRSSSGNMQLTPHGTDMYVRNYMNFGQEQERVYEPPNSLQACPLRLFDKIPPSSRADRIRELRRHFQN